MANPFAKIGYRRAGSARGALVVAAVMFAVTTPSAYFLYAFAQGRAATAAEQDGRGARGIGPGPEVAIGSACGCNGIPNQVNMRLRNFTGGPAVLTYNATAQAWLNPGPVVFQYNPTVIFTIRTQNCPAIGRITSIGYDSRL
jgi:hypothetical protein